jgi:D-glycero-alpha-D-manno-heptose-7-phosphate kinase
MVITQTPLRVSLLGGGTDFRDFYIKEGGAVLSLAIDKYVYVIIKERFDDKIYINYSKKEIVDSVDEIEHEMIREALRKSNIEKGVEITTLADVPSEGSGLGSSSSITLGLLNAFYAYQGMQVTAEELAKEACEIEIDILGKPLGIQDQYIAAYGGICFFQFGKDDRVSVERLHMTNEQKRKLVSNLLIFFTNKTRKSESILSEVKSNIEVRWGELMRIRDLAFEARKVILNGEIDVLGSLLHENWLAKKKLARSVSDEEIDLMYEKAMQAGCLGGKIAGAGGGGFLLVYCPREKQNLVREALREYRELPFLLSSDGSKVIFNIRSYDWK